MNSKRVKPQKVAYLTSIHGTLYAVDGKGMYIKKPGTQSLWSFTGQGEASSCLKLHGFRLTKRKTS